MAHAVIAIVVFGIIASVRQLVGVVMQFATRGLAPVRRIIIPPDDGEVLAAFHDLAVHAVRQDVKPAR
jgi:hypothetical protein